MAREGLEGRARSLPFVATQARAPGILPVATRAGSAAFDKARDNVAASRAPTRAQVPQFMVCSSTFTTILRTRVGVPVVRHGMWASAGKKMAN